MEEVITVLMRETLALFAPNELLNSCQNWNQTTFQYQATGV